MEQTFVIFDTEVTTPDDDGRSVQLEPCSFREIIQLGAVKVVIQRNELIAVDSLLTYCKPAVNFILSRKIQFLTGISQQQINTQGEGFELLMLKFFDFTHQGKLPLLGWGSDKFRILSENCQINDLTMPDFSQGFHDIREIFTANDITVSSVSRYDIAQVSGVDYKPQRACDSLYAVKGMLAALRQVYRNCTIPNVDEFVRHK